MAAQTEKHLMYFVHITKRKKAWTRCWRATYAPYQHATVQAQRPGQSFHLHAADAQAHGHVCVWGKSLINGFHLAQEDSFQTPALSSLLRRMNVCVCVCGGCVFALVGEWVEEKNDKTKNNQEVNHYVWMKTADWYFRNISTSTASRKTPFHAISSGSSFLVVFFCSCRAEESWSCCRCDNSLQSLCLKQDSLSVSEDALGCLVKLYQ